MADNIFGATAIPSQDFDGGWHTFGALAEVSEESNLVGGRAFFSNPEPANHLWVVFRVSDEAIIAQVDLAALAGTTPGAWNDFDSSDFDTPGDVALDPAEQYIPAVVTNGDFRFLDSGVSYPYGAGIVTASEGRFFNGGSGAVFPDSTSSSVVFGADMLVEAAGSEPSEVTLTTAVVTLAAQALTATPGVVTVALTPATYTLTAIAVTATPGVVTVALTTAVVSLEAQTLTVTPGVVTVELTPAVLTLTAPTLTATPGVVTVALAAATVTLAAQSLTATPGPVTTALTPAVLTLTAVQLTAGEPGVPTVWRAGPPESKWATGPPQSKWSIGRMPVEVFRATSTETIRSGSITADSAGAAVDPTGFTVTMAFAATNTAPAAASSAWKAATWDTNSTTTPTTWRAQAAIGPSGVQELSPGTHYLFVKIAASGETPIIPSGAFKVVA